MFSSKTFFSFVPKEYVKKSSYLIVRRCLIVQATSQTCKSSIYIERFKQKFDIFFFFAFCNSSEISFLVTPVYGEG